MADQIYSQDDIRPLLEALSAIANAQTPDALAAQQAAREALQKFGAKKQSPVNTFSAAPAPATSGRKRYKPEPLD